jgi:hypothetical protein
MISTKFVEGNKKKMILSTEQGINEKGPRRGREKFHSSLIP